MYAEVLSTPSRAADANGKGYAGAKWYFYEAGTTTLQAVYTTAALTTAHTNPVVADAGGLFPAIYFDPTKSYRGVCKNATGTVTLHDFSPINASLWAELALASGSQRVGHSDGGAGAVTRTLAAKLGEGAIDVRDYGTLGTADDTAVFQAAYNAAKAAKRPLRLPAGYFFVSGLVFDEPISVHGAGGERTYLAPTANGQTVVSLVESYASTTDRGDKWSVGDFTIDISAKSGCTGLYSFRLTRTIVERVNIIGDEYPSFAMNNIGWKSVADQYCAFRDIFIERHTRGFVMTSDPVAGGGLNNHFDGLHVAACQVNAMIYGSSPYPFGLNHFTNLRLQQSAHCSLYLNGVTNCYFSMLPPEADTATQATRTFDGKVIKRGTIHADNRSSARFDGYDHVNNDPLMRITADDHSSLQFSASSGAAVNTEADATSTIQWEGHWGNGSVFRNTRVSLQALDAFRSVQAWHPADARQSNAFPNECATPLAVPLHTQFGCTTTLIIDPVIGPAREVSYLASAGAISTNSVWARVNAADFQAADTIWGSILLWSDRNTQIGFNFAQSIVSGTIDLKAGQWTRLLAGNYNTSGTTRYGSIALWPVAADQPVLRIAQPVGCRNLTGQQTRLLSESHVFNPKDPAGMVLRMSAPPTTGSWTAGTVILNAAPSAGGVPGWVCVASGTPGTWKAQAALAA